MVWESNTTVIDDPAEYLKKTEHTGQITLLRSACVDAAKVPAYVITEYNGCAVNAAACLAAFAGGEGSDFESSLKLCKAIALRGYSRTSGSIVDYYTKLGKEAPFVRECLKAAGLGYGAKSSLFVKKRAVKEILAGRPVLLNIGISRQYRDHTVTAFGFEEYAAGKNGRKMLFFKVRDGYTKEDRYFLYRRIFGISVTYLKPER